MLSGMPVEFRKVSCPPLHALDVVAPDGAAIGIIGEDGSGKSMLLRLAAGLVPPQGGSVAVGARRRFLGPADALNFAPVDTLLLDHALATHDQLVRARAIMALDRLRQSGTTILFTSHDEDLLLDLADEIWWLKEGRLIGPATPPKPWKHIVLTSRNASGLGDRVFRRRFRHGCDAATDARKFWPSRPWVKTGNPPACCAAARCLQCACR
jgi:ABC-type sulfate/molybdate transport systems ATPase subunit